jgi:hypothetical protein
VPNADSNPVFFHILTIGGGYLTAIMSSPRGSCSFLTQMSRPGFNLKGQKGNHRTHFRGQQISQYTGLLTQATTSIAKYFNKKFFKIIITIF